MIIKQKLRGRFLAVCFSVLYLFVLGFQLLLPVQSVRAETYSLLDKAKAYGAARAIYQCANTGGVRWKTAISGSDYSLAEIKEGDIWERTISASPVSGAGMPAGYLVDAKDGNTDCVNNKDVLQLFGAVGVSGDKLGQFLADINIVNLSGDKAGWNLDDKNDSDEKRANALKKKFEDTYGIDIDKAMPLDMAYLALGAALKACKTTEVTGGEKAILVDSKGNKTEKFYAFGTDSDISAGWGLPNDGGNNGSLSCVSVARGTVDTANAFAATAFTANAAGNPISTAPTLGGAGNEPQKTTCESSWTNPLAWIMCGVFNMFAEASDAFYNSILQPFLYTPPVSTDPGSPTFKAWSNFRIIGNIFLIITMLVVVFGQTIGGGVVDAYTAKKVLPRLLTGAILINLSVYIVAIMVDLTNVLGNGISQLLLMPFNGVAGFNLSGSAQVAGAGSVLGAGILGAGSIAGFLTAGMSVFPMIIFTIVIPTFLAMLSVFATLVIRRGIILALIISSPVAFALYCLPNTEKYFRKWWQLLFTTLSVYPIVMSIFAISSIMSLLIVDANSGLGAGSIASIVAFALQIIPLFLVPYAFKLAGGAIGNLNNTLTGMKDKSGALFKSRKDQAMTDYNNRSIQGRQEQYQRGQSMQNSTGFVTKRLGRLRSGAVGGYNIEAAASAARAAEMKVLNDQIATGKDEEIRGLTVNKKTAKAGPRATWNANTKSFDGPGNYGVDDKGRNMYKTLGGAWVSESDVDAGQRRWGRDVFAQQAALSYEMRKAATADQVQNISDNYANVAAGWGMTEQQAKGTFIGAGFENQGTHLEFKHTKLNLDTDARGRVTGGTASLDRKKFVEEMYEKKGAYPLSQMSGHTVEQLGNAYDEATAVGDTATMTRVQAVVETFVQRGATGPAGATQQLVDVDGKIQPMQVATGGGGGTVAQTYSSGSASFNEGMNLLAQKVGVGVGAPPTMTTAVPNRPAPGSSQNVINPQDFGPSGPPTP